MKKLKIDHETSIRSKSLGAGCIWRETQEGEDRAVSLLLLLPCLPLSRVLEHLDGEAIQCIAQVNRALAAVVNMASETSATQTLVISYEEWRHTRGARIDRLRCLPCKPRIEDPDVVSRNEFAMLLQLAVLAGKFQCYEKYGPNQGIGCMACRGDVYALLPPGFYALVQQVSRSSVEQVRGVQDRHRILLAALDQHDKGMLMRIQRGKEQEEDEQRDGISNVYGKDSGLGDTSEEFYNAKQDLLNYIVDIVENQFQFCSKILKFFHIADETARINHAMSACRAHRWITPQHAKSLYEDGFCIVENFLDGPMVATVFDQCLEYVLKTSQLMNLPQEELAKIEEPPFYWMSRGTPHNARGDILVWLTPGQPPTSLYPFTQVMSKYDDLQSELGKIVHLEGGNESQLAFYPDKGQGYRRHRDALPDDGSQRSDNRRLTAITYCNVAWEEAHGGKLRFWLGQRHGYQVIEIDPLPGRLLVFFSGLFDHEVRPSFHARVALTRWMW